jgi:hypothetical protein
MPHRPSTQPPMRRPNVDDLRDPGAAVELVLLLSAETTDADSDGRLLPAATDARREREDWPGALARSAVIIGTERTGGVETSSMLGETMRCGIRMPGCQSPMRERRSFGVWISMPATESRLSCEVDLRKGGKCMANNSSAVVGAGPCVVGSKYDFDGDGSDSSGMDGCVARPSPYTPIDSRCSYWSFLK